MAFVTFCLESTTGARLTRVFGLPPEQRRVQTTNISLLVVADNFFFAILFKLNAKYAIIDDCKFFEQVRYILFSPDR